MGLWKGAALLGNNLAIPQNVKHEVTMWPNNSPSGCMTKRTENISLLQNLDMNVHSSVSHNSQAAETIQMSIIWWMEKEHEAYSNHRILFSNEKEWSTDTLLKKKKAEPWKHYAKQKMLDITGHI